MGEVTRQQRSRRTWQSFGMCVQQCGRLSEGGTTCRTCRGKERARYVAKNPAAIKYRCGSCGKMGHNKRTCQEKPTDAV